MSIKHQGARGAQRLPTGNGPNLNAERPRRKAARRKALPRGPRGPQVPIDNSSRTSGVFAANPHRPIFNPYTQRSLYKNKRYLKHKQNRKYKDIQYKFTYKQQQEREQNPEQNKKQQAGMKVLPNTAHQLRGAE
jgi:hypothetical protein